MDVLLAVSLWIGLSALGHTAVSQGGLASVGLPARVALQHFYVAAAGSQAAAPAAAPKPETALSKAKDIADVLHSIFTILAIAVGGVWTYMLFVKKRQKYPRAKTTHTIMHKPLAHNCLLLHVTTNVSNSGEVLLRLVSGFTRVQQVLPPPASFTAALSKGQDPVAAGETEYPWPLLGERTWDWKKAPHEVEPGENEEIHCDFVLPDTARSLEIYTYVQNEAKPHRKIGWNLTTVFDL